MLDLFIRRSLVLSTVLALGWPLSSVAAVVDKFQCEVNSALSDGAPQLQLQFVTAVAREIVPDMSDDRIQVTHGRFGAFFAGPGEPPGNYPRGDFAYFYWHAVEYDGRGNPLRAVQALGTGFCTQLDRSNGQCGDSFVACTQPGDDPFDPECRWQPVPIIDGIPELDSTDITPIVYEREPGVMRIACDHVETLE